MEHSVLKEEQDPENAGGSGSSGASSEAATVAAALREAERLVESLGPCAGQPRLRQMLAVVRRSLGAWDIRPPPARQLEFLTRIIEDILREAAVEAPAGELRGTA